MDNWAPLFPEIDDPLRQSAWRSMLGPDPAAERVSWRDWQPPPLYGYGAGSRFDQIGYAPAPRGEMYEPLSSLTGWGQIEANVNDWIAQNHPEWLDFAPGTIVNPGQMSSLGGEWANIDRWNNEIAAAQARVQRETGVYVPGNVIKAIMRIESGGNPAEGPAYGLMQVTSGAMGNYDLARAVSDPAYGLWAGVNDLALRYQHAKSINPAYDWPNVAVGYFSGHYEPTGAMDSLGTSDSAYQQAFNRYLNELNAAGFNQTGSGVQAPQGATQLNAIWGGFDAPVTQEYGPTDFSEGNPWYDYGPDYGVTGHPGLDIGLVAGTRLFTPVSGVVERAGGTGAYTDWRYGNSPGTGELRIRLANGDVIILGHMGQIDVKIGDVVTPGQYVGLSGNANGDHLHLEYRMYDPSWTRNDENHRIVDPRLALGGAFTGGFGQAPGVGVGRPVPGAGTWQAFMRQAAQGGALPGPNQSAYAGESAWRDWLRGQMGVGTPPIAFYQPPGSPDVWDWMTQGFGYQQPGPPSEGPR